MDLGLTNAVVLITGGSKGIGLACAQAFAAEGARARSPRVTAVAASDYVRAWPQLVASYVEAPLTALGTDGFGRSDTRAALRSFFGVDRHHIVLAALTALRLQGKVDTASCAEAISRYGLQPEQPPSWTC